MFFMMKRKTTIQVSVETRDRLKEIGKKGETYDDIIRRLLKLLASTHTKA